nr:hypothetical protein [Tanacetum cinerariifolium]
DIETQWEVHSCSKALGFSIQTCSSSCVCFASAGTGYDGLTAAISGVVPVGYSMVVVMVDNGSQAIITLSKLHDMIAFCNIITPPPRRHRKTHLNLRCRSTTLHTHHTLPSLIGSATTYAWWSRNVVFGFEDFKQVLEPSIRVVVEPLTISKDTSGPESLEELRRGWYVEGQIRSGVISPVLAQQYQDTVRQRRVSPKAKNRHTPEGQGDCRTGAELRKEPEGRNPKPDEGGPHIKKQVRTLSMRKARKTIVKILTHPTKDLNLLLSPPESLVSYTIGGLCSTETSGCTKETRIRRII